VLLFLSFECFSSRFHDQTLNEEQTILVASRPSLGKALAEIESIKKQLEEVAEKEVFHASLGLHSLTKFRKPQPHQPRHQKLKSQPQLSSNQLR
jgi:hypothetical protein